MGENSEILGGYVGCYFFLQPVGDTEMVVFMYMMGVCCIRFYLCNKGGLCIVGESGRTYFLLA